MGRCCRELLWEAGAMQWGDAGGEVLGGEHRGEKLHGALWGYSGGAYGGCSGGVLRGC